MGQIRFVPSKTIEGVVGGFNLIHTTNWRILFVFPNNKLIVYLQNFHGFDVHDITPEEFHSNNENKSSIHKPFKFVANNLPCSECKGTGVIDWIQNAMGSSKNVAILGRYKYTRNPHQIVRYCHGHGYVDADTSIFGSIPNVKKGFVMCKKCMGTGVHSFGDTYKTKIY